ncbi:Thioredoxin-2 [Blattella germanica]|nr:Thioredoxin-2 [Blattella germanica]
MGDFQNKLKEAEGKLVCVDFFATWCGPCKVIAPKVELLAAEHPDVVFLKVDVDECEDIATEYDIKAMPTFVFIKNGSKIDDFSGNNADMLERYIKQHK